MKLPFAISIEQALGDPILDIQESMDNNGIEAPQMLVLDSNFHRFGKNNACWYVGSFDPVPWCTYGDWHESDVSYKWVQTHVGTRAEREIVALKIRDAIKERMQLKEAEYKQAVEKAIKILNSTPIATSTPYTEKKGVIPMNALQKDNTLIIPVMGKDGNPQSLQYIAADGSKKFLPGGKVKGGFVSFKGIDDVIFLCEGWATGRSIHEATGRQTYCSFSAGNLSEVARIIKEKWNKEPVVVADNDKSGTGEKEAIKTECPYVLIPIVGMDANDYVQSGHDLKSLLLPKEEHVSEVTQTDGYMLSARDFLESQKQTRWLIKNYLPRESFCMLFGASGSGKTFIAMDWIMHICSGTPSWFSERVHEGKVAYLCGEGRFGVANRLRAWMLRNKGMKLDNLLISQGATDLNNYEGLKIAIEGIRERDFKPDLVVVDTLNRFYSGDENSSQDARSFIKGCSALTEEFGCTVLVIHHTGVSDDAKKRARGSSAFRGALDMEVCVESLENGSISLEVTKSKDSMIPNPKYLKLESVDLGFTDEDGDMVTSAVVVKGSDEPVKKTHEYEKERSEVLDIFKNYGELDLDNNLFVSRDNVIEWFMKQYPDKTRANARSFFNSDVRSIGKLTISGLLYRTDAAVYIKDESLRLIANILSQDHRRQCAKLENKGGNLFHE